MKPIISAIYFNHNKSSKKTSALNIRASKQVESHLPEYLKGSRSEAVYSIEQTRGQDVTIEVHFDNSQGDSKTYEIKAEGGGVLGKIDPFKVNLLRDIRSMYINPVLKHRKFEAVGKYRDKWTWFYREASGTAWKPLIEFEQTVFLVLGIPDQIWTQLFAHNNNPWTFMLDYLCPIAQGAKTQAEATTKMLHLIYETYDLKYDIDIGNSRYFWYIQGTVDHYISFDNWFNYIINKSPPTHKQFCAGTPEQYNDFKIVNCYDCAGLLFLYSTLLGVDAKVFKQEPFGYLKYVYPIGRGKCNNPFYGCLYSAYAALKMDEYGRSKFALHTYVKISEKNNFDATMMEWFSLPRMALYTLQFMREWGSYIAARFRPDAKPKPKPIFAPIGVLANLSQSEYESRVLHPKPNSSGVPVYEKGTPRSIFIKNTHP